MMHLDIVMASGGSIIDLDVTFLILVGIFFVVMIVLTTLIFNPMFAVIDARRKAVEGAMEDSKKLRKEANVKKEEYDARIAEIKRRAGDEREAMRTAARKAEGEILDRGKTDAQKTLDEARDALASQIAEARSSLVAESRKLGEALADRVLGQIAAGGKP